MIITNNHRRAISLFLEQCLLKNLSPLTVRSYNSDLLCFFTWLNSGTRLPDISTKTITTFINASRRGTLGNEYSKASPATCNHRLVCLRCFFSFLVSIGTMKTNPASVLPLFRLPPSDREWLPTGIISHLLLTAKKKSPLDFIIVYVLYTSALRRHEICSLRKSDIDITHKTITIHGKGNKVRCVPVLDHEFKPILSWLRHNSPATPDSPFIATLQGKPCTDKFINDRITRIARRCRVHCTPHVLRRSRATHLLQKGMALPELREFLGHSSIKTTELYAIVPPKAVKTSYAQAAAKMAL